MLKRLNLSYLGILVGIIYWPFEASIHDFIWGSGSFVDSLLSSDPDEIWMRTLMTSLFIAFGMYAQRMVAYQEQLQTQLRKKSERLHQIIDCTYDAYVSIDESGTIIGWNRSAEILFGWPSRSIIGKNVELIIPDRMRLDHHHGMQRYKKDSIGPKLYKPMFTQGLHRDGFEFSVEMVLTPIKSDGQQEFFAFIREQSN